MSDPSFAASIQDPNLRAAVLAAHMVEQALAAPPKYDPATLDAAQHAIRGLILESKFRETAATLNRAIAAIEKLRA